MKRVELVIFVALVSIIVAGMFTLLAVGLSDDESMVVQSTEPPRPEVISNLGTLGYADVNIGAGEVDEIVFPGKPGMGELTCSVWNPVAVQDVRHQPYEIVECWR